MNYFVIYLVLTTIVGICFCIRLHNEYIKLHPVATFKYWLWYNGYYEVILGLLICWVIAVPIWLLTKLLTWLSDKN